MDTFGKAIIALAMFEYRKLKNEFHLKDPGVATKSREGM